MNLNKLLSIFIIWSSIVTTIPFVSNDVSNIVVTMNAVKGRLGLVLRQMQMFITNQKVIKEYLQEDIIRLTKRILGLKELVNS